LLDSFTKFTPLETLLSLPRNHSALQDTKVLELLLSKGADPRRVDEVVWHNFFETAETAFGGNFVTGLCKTLLEHVRGLKAKEEKRAEDKEMEHGESFEVSD
jgi:hypothetical protein